jgi:hypothetical protein
LDQSQEPKAPAVKREAEEDWGTLIQLLTSGSQPR